MAAKTAVKDCTWERLVEDVMPSMGKTPELIWRQKDENSTDRVVVNLPRSVVELIDLYVGRRGMRDLVVQAILDYLHVFTNQIDINEEDRPILASSPTGTALKVLAKQQDLTEGTLLRVGAHMLVTLLTRNGDDQKALLNQLREFCEARGGKIGDAAATIIQAGLRVHQVAPEALAAESEAEFKALFKKGAR
jgi:hypothetical protein